VLRLARDEKAVQGKHFELLTVVKTPKIAEIRNFQNLDNFPKKKVEYLGNGSSYENFARDPKCSE